MSTAHDASNPRRPEDPIVRVGDECFPPPAGAHLPGCGLLRDAQPTVVCTYCVRRTWRLSSHVGQIIDQPIVAEPQGCRLGLTAETTVITAVVVGGFNRSSTPECWISGCLVYKGCLLSGGRTSDFTRYLNTLRAPELVSTSSELRQLQAKNERSWFENDSCQRMAVAFVACVTTRDTRE